MYKVLLALVLVVLVGCKDEEKYRQANNKVLCDPDTKEAYYVRSSGGYTSYVLRNESLDKVCNNE